MEGKAAAEIKQRAGLEGPLQFVPIGSLDEFILTKVQVPEYNNVDQTVLCVGVLPGCYELVETADGDELERPLQPRLLLGVGSRLAPVV